MTLGVPLRVAAADVDERRLPGERPDDYLARIVADKLAAVAAMSAAEGAGAILVADTSVIVSGEPIGKPADADEAASMLRRLSGRSHEVWTRFAIAAPTNDRADACGATIARHAETVRTTVWFRALDDEEIAGYAASGEGMDKAGAYAIQGIGAFAVARIEGSYANVVGLPAAEVIVALRRTELLPRFPLQPLGAR